MGGCPLRILIVDDNREFCDNMKDILDLQGHKAACVYNGKAALEKIKNNAIDLALVDIVMPEMDGLTLLKEIKAVKPKLPVMLVTGFAHEHSTGEAMRSGALALLKKPVDFDELTRMLKKVG